MKNYDLKQAKRLFGVLKVLSSYGNVVVADETTMMTAKAKNNVTVFIAEQVEDIVTGVIGEPDVSAYREILSILEEAAFRSGWIEKKEESAQRAKLLTIFGEPAIDDGSNEESAATDNGYEKILLNITSDDDDSDDDDDEDNFVHTRAFLSTKAKEVFKAVFQLPWGTVWTPDKRKEKGSCWDNEVWFPKTMKDIFPEQWGMVYKNDEIIVGWEYIDIEEPTLLLVKQKHKIIKDCAATEEQVDAVLTCFMSQYRQTWSDHDLKFFERYQKNLKEDLFARELANKIDTEAMHEYDEWPTDQQLTEWAMRYSGRTEKCVFEENVQLRPEKRVQKLKFAHGLKAYSTASPLMNAKALKDNMGVAQICCTLQGEEVGNVGVWIQGAVLALSIYDLFSFRPEYEDGSFGMERYAYLSKDEDATYSCRNIFVTKYEQLQQAPDAPHREAVIIPHRIVGVWVKQDAPKKDRRAAVQIACLFKKPLSVI